LDDFVPAKQAALQERIVIW